MASTALPLQSPAPPHPTRALKLTRWASFSLLAGLMPMVIAGEAASPYLWALAVACSAVAFYAVHTVSPELARERYHPPNPGLDGTTLHWVRAIALGTTVLALLDSGRWHLSPSMPAGWRIAGLVAFLSGIGMFVYAMSVNRFFSSVVRIQDDRGHHVIDSGPYGYVRHPGVSGFSARVRHRLVPGIW